ncbi:hypothetical protein J2T18_001467 [Paenibacillus polymyxa]|uniref:hypothetical protein n=1 Tax=Paenibacillus polymyxa TaxID=1406 RepID=UPI00278CBC68|nr:hypothetical protein [Paenibacillus polymyxa]MDQ0047184.1 hypothetical protein [Paenibacillus polymyxa]
MTYIPEQTYWKISKRVYADLEVGETIEGASDWTVVKSEHIKDSGFDASVFYNKKTDQIIIGYRGTEPDQKGHGDLGADVFDVFGGRARNQEEMQEYIFAGNDRHPNKYAQDTTGKEYRDNQFYQAEQLYKSVNKEYPNSEVTTTGHSLGGGEAEYVAIRNGLRSLTYNPPSIYPLLTDEQIEASKRGDYDKTNIAVVNPADIVGSGPSRIPWSHVGSTFFINSSRQDALDKTLILRSSDTDDDPYVIKVGEYGIWDQIERSFFRKETHSLVHFNFDENGNLTNDLYTVDGERVYGDPIAQAYYDNLVIQDNKKKALAAFIHDYGSKLGIIGEGLAKSLGVTIALRPEELKAAGETMRRHVQTFQSQLPVALQKIEMLVGSSRSQSLTPVAQQLIQDLQTFNRWYEGSADRIADYINRKAADFAQVDQAN